MLQELHIVIVVTMSPWQHTRYQTSTFPKWQMHYLLLESLTDSLVSVLCNVHICLHPWNEHQEQITLLEGGILWFYPLERVGLNPIVLPWKCYSGHIMELCDEYDNGTKFQFYAEEVLRGIPFFVILHHFVSTLWRHNWPNLHKSKYWRTRLPRVLEE